MRAAAARAGAKTWNVAKIARGAVSLLLYEEFEESAFPALLQSASPAAHEALGSLDSTGMLASNLRCSRLSSRAAPLKAARLFFLLRPPLLLDPLRSHVLSTG